MAHGRSLLEEMAVSMKLGEAKRLTNHKRMITADSISCIELTPVDPNAMIKLREVPIDMDLAGSWRYGLNKSVVDLLTKSTDLVHHELAKHELGLTTLPSGEVALVTCRSRKEGEKILDCSALHFDSRDALARLLNKFKDSMPELSSRVLQCNLPHDY